jgi:DNA mismatch endonuclease (patch repair protein)
MDKISRERRTNNMRKIRSWDTVPELIVRRLVHSMGFRYRLHVASLPGKPDLVFPRLRRIVEVNGCFWHQHAWCVDSHIPKTRRDYWEPKLVRNQERDLLDQRMLKSMGWRVLVIWECETSDPNRLKKRVSRFLKE